MVKTVTSKRKKRVRKHLSSTKRKKHGVTKKNKSRKRTLKKTSFSSVARKIKQNMIKEKAKNISGILKVALKTVKNSKGKVKLPSSRVIQIPKTGGVLPLIPIFAGLSALGALTGGAAGVAKAVNDARAANHQLKENKRHNETMEAIALGKGLYLKPYKTGMGLFLNPYTTTKKKNF